MQKSKYLIPRVVASHNRIKGKNGQHFGRAIAIMLGLLLGAALSACDDNDGGSEQNTTTETGGDNTSLVVQTQYGKVSGIRQGSMRKFLGIPYAAPPVGELRWKPPQPAEPWTGVLKAHEFAPFCPQVGRASSQTEDCLYLNVYTPVENGTYPVMVWTYGGGFVRGQSNFYNPVRFVHRGMVVVTLNYRVGALGLLALPALTREAPANIDSGNYSILDQRAALRWVQNNIAAFGGNPDNVTLFGESAGGLSVLMHLIAPGSKGLFNKAIVESGTYL